MAKDAALRLLILTRDDANATMTRLQGQIGAVGKAARAAHKDAKSFTGVFREISGAIPGLNMLAGAGLVGGIALIAKGAVDLGQKLGTMGEESAQLEARFRAFAGGSRQAAVNLGLMNQAVEGALSEDNQMIALNSLMASGLVETAAEAANVAQAALWLGDATKQPIERIEALTNALLSGRTRGLVPYGVDIDRLKARVEELQGANTKLTDSQATLTAFLEQAGPAMKRVADEGGKAVTSAQELKAAWEDLQDAFGNRAKPLSQGIDSDLTLTLNALTQAVNGKQVELKPGDQGLVRNAIVGVSGMGGTTMSRAREELAIATDNLANAEKMLLTVRRSGAPDASVAMAEKRVAELAAVQQSAMVVLESLGSAATDVVGPLDLVERKLRNIQYAATALAQSEKAAAIQQPGTGGMPWRPGWGADPMLKLDQGADAALRSALGDRYKWQADQNEKLAEAAAKSFESAFDDATSRIRGFLGQGMSSAQGLLKGFMPGAGNPMDDPNGPMRDVRRALDVAKLGEASPWFKTLGISVEQAQKVAGDVNRGLFTDAVAALVDKEQLAALVQAEKESEANMQRFAASLDGLVGAVETAISRLGSVNYGPLASGASGGAAGPVSVTNNTTNINAPTYADNRAVYAQTRAAAVARKVERISSGL